MANNSNPTPLDMLYKWEKEKPNEVYFNQPINGKYLEFTWKQVAAEARKLASALKATGLPPGSNIGLVSKNCAHWIITDLAIMLSGHVSVPIYPNIGPDTLNYVLTHSGAPILFAGKLDTWGKMKAGVPEGTRVIAFPTSLYGPEGHETWESFTDGHAPLQGNPGRGDEELMTIIYTSGTTGAPKGVMHDFGALSYAVDNALSVVDTTEGRFFSYLPMCHIAERLLVEMGSIYSGNPIYFAESLDTFAQNLAHASPTVFLGVPRIWTKFQMKILEKMPQQRLDLLFKIPFISGIIKKKIRTTLGLNSAVHCFTGAAPTPPALMRWFDKLGVKIQEVYGMTENCAYSHYTRKNNIKIGYTGQPMPHVQVKIDPDSEEILVKSRANMLGYYKQPELTAEVFTADGFFRTGDCGEEARDGALKITGRVKDIFKTAKGKYVAPSPIELSLAKNSNIEQVCVVGVSIPQPIALVVLSEEAQKKDRGDLEESLSNTLKELNPTLDKHERLKTIVVLKEAWDVDNGFLTPTLKVKRKPLEKKFKSNYGKWYDHKGHVAWT